MNASLFPLTLAQSKEILTIGKIEASLKDQELILSTGLLLNSSVQFLKKANDDFHLLTQTGQIITLTTKLARMVRVSLCSVKSEKKGCGDCHKKGFCHG